MCQKCCQKLCLNIYCIVISSDMINLLPVPRIMIHVHTPCYPWACLMNHTVKLTAATETEIVHCDLELQGKML